MKKTGILSGLLMLAALSYAQPKLQFEQTTYDFGTIKEEGGKVTGKFAFTNVGTEDLLLLSVVPGCGCTVADYTKTAVKPGEQGYINATYDPYNRPGGFNKNIRIRTNEPSFNDPATHPYNIYIKGEVTKRPPTEYEIHGYKAGRGELRLKTQSVKFDIKNTEFHLDTFMIRNFSGKQAATIGYKDLPPYITEAYRSFGNELKPGQEGFIVLKYDAAKRQAWGNLVDKIILTTNDAIEVEKAIHYSVTLTEDFSKLSANDLKKAPVIAIDSFTVNFGQVKQGTPVTKEFTITNKGKSTLAIRQCTPSTGAISCKLEQEAIAPGKSTKLTIIYDTKNRRGKQSSTVDIVSNDPRNPSLVIKFTGDILP